MLTAIDTPEDALQRCEEIAVLQRLLKTLDPRERQAFTLGIEDMSLFELADALGTSAMNAGRLFDAALRNVRNGVAAEESAAERRRLQAPLSKNALAYWLRNQQIEELNEEVIALRKRQASAQYRRARAKEDREMRQTLIARAMRAALRPQKTPAGWLVPLGGPRELELSHAIAIADSRGAAFGAVLLAQEVQHPTTSTSVADMCRTLSSSYTLKGLFYNSYFADEVSRIDDERLSRIGRTKSTTPLVRLVQTARNKPASFVGLMRRAA